MTYDLGNGNTITVNRFHGKVWLQVTAVGGGVVVALPPDIGKEVGGEIHHAARMEARAFASAS